MVAPVIGRGVAASPPYHERETPSYFLIVKLGEIQFCLVLAVEFEERMAGSERCLGTWKRVFVLRCSGIAPAHESSRRLCWFPRLRYSLQPWTGLCAREQCAPPSSLLQSPTSTAKLGSMPVGAAAATFSLLINAQRYTVVRRKLLRSTLARAHFEFNYVRPSIEHRIGAPVPALAWTMSLKYSPLSKQPIM